MRYYPVPAFLQTSFGIFQTKHDDRNLASDSFEGGRRPQVHDAGLGSELVVENELIVGCCGTSSE